MSVSPCFRCEQRAEGCHARCQNYRVYAACCAAIRGERTRQRPTSDYIDDNIHDRLRRSKLTTYERWQSEKRRRG